MQSVTFDYALGVLEALPEEEQVALLKVWQKRMARRDEILAEIEEGKAEFGRGELKRMSASDLMKDLLE
jgi:hypothetical protein